MIIQSQQLHEVRINKAHNKYDDYKKEAQESSEVIRLKDWYQKMMPNYEKAEVWLDDSIEPIKWQDSKLGRL